MSDDLANLLYAAAIVAALVAGVFGFAWWANKARTDRTALVGLYMVIGIPAILLDVFGMASIFRGTGNALIWFGLGVGMTLPLLPAFRRSLAQVTPLDPRSPIDMAGLCFVLAAIFALAASNYVDPSPDDVGADPSLIDLGTQFTAGILIAFPLVGMAIWRNGRQAVARLGLNRPDKRVIGAAFASLFIAFVLMIVAGALTAILQPDVNREIERITDEITSNVSSPLGAVFFGAGAGASEELLLRGAIQPRFGIAMTAILFGLLHNQYGFSFILLGVMAIGALLGFQRRYFGTTSAILTHAMFNAISVLLSR